VEPRGERGETLARGDRAWGSQSDDWRESLALCLLFAITIPPSEIYCTYIFIAILDSIFNLFTAFFRRLKCCFANNPAQRCCVGPAEVSASHIYVHPRWPKYLSFIPDFTFKIYKSFSLVCTTLIKKKIKFSSYVRKFRVEQLQSNIRGRAS
jgi:hypothetical protein